MAGDNLSHSEKGSIEPHVSRFWLREVAPGTALDFDVEGNVVGIKIYARALSKVDLSKLRLERSLKKGFGRRAQP